MTVTSLFRELAKQLLEVADPETVNDLLDQIEEGFFYANTPLHFFGFHLNEAREAQAIDDTFDEMVKDLDVPDAD